MKQVNVVSNGDHFASSGEPDRTKLGFGAYRFIRANDEQSPGISTQSTTHANDGKSQPTGFVKDKRQKRKTSKHSCKFSH